MNRQQRRAAEAIRRKGGMHDATTRDLPTLNVELTRAMQEGLKDGDVVHYGADRQRYVVSIVNDGYRSGQDLANMPGSGLMLNIDLSKL